MSMKDFLCPKKPPCAQCPYTLGLVKTLRNPCPECRLSDYQMYEIFQKRGYMGNPSPAEPEKSYPASGK